MARKLKTYRTSLGFFEQAIAAPSMKAALEAWGADSNLFHQGAAKESTDPEIVAATMKQPGVVLKRPVGSNGSFAEHAKLPTNLGRGQRNKPAPAPTVRKAKQSSAGPDKTADRKAARAYEAEQRRRAREQAREAAAQRKQREGIQRAVDKAQAALDAAEREHDERQAAIDAEREELEARSQAENAKWDKERARLRAALKRARN
jgi:hypothetical protein